jgi:DtxR family transcriptional regulator, iron-dependent repressor
MPVTAVAKEYVLAIYALAEEGKPVIGARLAERLKVTPPTVTQTLQRLTRDGLVEIEARRGILLTSAGREVAEEALRRQRLSERWLIEMLGLEWAEAHAAARAMEGAISPRIAERLDAMLGHPTTCPHGNPIAAPGALAGPEAGVWPLDRVEAGAVVVLERIVEDGEHARELLTYLEKHGLRPGARLTVAAVEPWAHTITLRHGEAEIVLGARVAGQLWARRVTAGELARTLAPTPSECPEEDAYVAEVESVEAPCPAGHQAGDRFVFGQRTPCGLCGEAFVEMYPRLADLRERAAARRGESVAVACPEHGNVTFRLRLVGAATEAAP